jgi:queuine/archaeosine tRNA-ribosyltransferase
MVSLMSKIRQSLQTDTFLKAKKDFFAAYRNGKD